MIDLTRPSPEVARGLIGALLTFDGVGGVVVETEAYDMPFRARRHATPRCSAPSAEPMSTAHTVCTGA